MRFALPLLVLLALAGCGRHGVPLTREQLATVQRAVDSCTAASARLTPHLKAKDHAGAQTAAIDARNGCSVARGDVVKAVGTGSRLDACYFAIDRQEAAQVAELRSLDDPTLDNGRAVLAALDDAIRQGGACTTAIHAAAQGG